MSGPDLYRRNAFRITGLPTDAGGRTVREYRQKVTAALAVGAAVDTGSELPLPVPATSEEIRAAFDDLGDAQRRVVDELFWWWDTPDATCSCVSALHGDHDAAVRAHARALDAELAANSAPRNNTGNEAERDELWIDAAQRWTALLRRAAFWDHVRQRMHALDDRRLDESTLDALRDTLPRALVRPVVDLAAAADQPARLAAHAARWFAGQDVADDLLADAAATLLGSVSMVADQASEHLDAGRPRDATAALDTAVPVLHRLEGLAPHERHRRTATARNGVAVLLNNCAFALMDGPGPTTAVEVGGLLDSAHGLAVVAETRRTIEANRAVLDERASAGLAGGRLPAGPARVPGGLLDIAQAVGQVIMAGIAFTLIAGAIYGLIRALFSAFFGAFVGAIAGGIAGVIALAAVAFIMVLAIAGTVDEVRAKRGGRR